MRACPPCAAQCYNHRKFNGLPHSRVPLVPTPQKSYCRHYSTANGWQCMGVRCVAPIFCGGALPPQAPPSKIVWGQMPPYPPGSAAYDTNAFRVSSTRGGEQEGSFPPSHLTSPPRKTKVLPLCDTIIRIHLYFMWHTERQQALAEFLH